MITAICFLILGLLGYQAAALNCSYSNTKFWDQRLDHWGNNGTFKQQYQVIDDFYKPGGPILFYQGAENNKISCLVGLRLDIWNETDAGSLTEFYHETERLLHSFICAANGGFSCPDRTSVFRR